MSTATELDGATVVAEFDPGETYMIDLIVGGGAQDTCAPALNEEHQMTIAADGGGSTYETLYISDDARGSLVI